MLEQKIILRAKTVGFQPVIKTSQGDTGRKLLCSFEDFTIPDSSTAKIYVLKPSGKSVQNDATISDQTITVELTNQILAEKGIVACQIQIINSGKAIKSFEFSLDNERSLAGDWPESENENTFLEGVVSEMQAKLTETINQANAATSAANTATQSANTATANANAATSAANTATQSANTATANANAATQNAYNAAETANAAAQAVMDQVNSLTFALNPADKGLDVTYTYDTETE